MKKLKLLVFSALLQFCLLASAQSSVNILTGITEKNAIGFMANYNYGVKKNNYEFGISHSLFEDKKYIPMKFSTTAINAGYLYNAFKNRTNSINFNIGAGLLGYYEHINNPDRILLNSKNGIGFGVFAVAQTDIYLFDRLSFLLRVQQNYMPKSTTGNFNPFLALGLRYIIN